MNNTHGKNKRVHLLPLLALVILVTLASGTVVTEAAGLRLIYSNDNLGELDGCG